MLGSQPPLYSMGQALPPQFSHTAPGHMFENLLVPDTGAQAQDETDPRRLCILGLPWDTTEEMLHAHFSQFGALEVLLTTFISPQRLLSLL